MTPQHSFENNPEDQEILRQLKDLQDSGPSYPPELLKARRAEFLAQIDRLEQAEAERELEAGDQEIVRLLGRLKSAQPAYPADLLAARRAAFLRQMGAAQPVSLWGRLQRSIERFFPSDIEVPRVSAPQFRRTSLVVAVLMAAAWIGSLVFTRAQQALYVSPSLATPTSARPSNGGEQTLLICEPGDTNALCSPNELDSSPDLAQQGQGKARAAVSSDEAASPASHVNDGRSDTSWVSDRPQGWVKLDLGDVTLINSVTLEKAGAGPAGDPGQFVIAVSLSDLYSGGDSSNDPAEYAQVFNSEQSGFSGTTGDTETVRAVFPPVQARYLKITFQKAGAAIEEVGVFMVRPPALTAAPNRTRSAEASQATVTLIPPTGGLPTQTLPPLVTDTLPPSLAPETAVPPLGGTAIPPETASPLPTDTVPADTATPVPTQAPPSDTPVASATTIPLTAGPPAVGPPALSTDPLIITGSGQTLTLTCDGNEVVVRGSQNTVTLLGACSSITVTGSRNQVFWQFGAPLIVNRGQDNLIGQQ